MCPVVRSPPTMNNNGERWILPSGVEEMLPADAAQVEYARRKVLDLFHSWGYDQVITPFIEFLDSLFVGAGSDLDLHTFKVIDQLTGRLMGIRTDMTPQIARMDARERGSNATSRLCYLGTVLHALPDELSGSRSPFQIGAELFGHSSLEGDCEIICLMLETLSALGLNDVHLDLGHVGIYRGLVHAADLNREQEAELHNALQLKSQAEVDQKLAAWSVSPTMRSMLGALVGLHGDRNTLDWARRELQPAPDEIHIAIDTLAALADAVQMRSNDLPIHFDLAELRGYSYHTGVLFGALVSGQAREIARGGRYNETADVLGASRFATGFSADLHTLVRLAPTAADIDRPLRILAPWDDDPELLRTIRCLRKQGQRVVYALPTQTKPPLPIADTYNCNHSLTQVDGQWVVRPLSGDKT